MRDSLSVLPEMFVAGSTTPAGSRCSQTFAERCKASEMSPSCMRVSVFVSASVRESHISNMLSKELPSARCRRWLYEDIKEARFMRFLLEVKHANANANPDLLSVDTCILCLHRVWLEDVHMRCSSLCLRRKICFVLHFTGRYVLLLLFKFDLSSN